MDSERDKVRKSLSDLTREELLEEVVRCHLHMERCLEVLCGKSVEPVELVDVNDSTDLELFYKCKSVSSRLQCVTIGEKRAV